MATKLPTVTISRSTGQNGRRHVRVLYQGGPVMADELDDEAGNKRAATVEKTLTSKLSRYRVTCWDGDTFEETVLREVC